MTFAVSYDIFVIGPDRPFHAVIWYFFSLPYWLWKMEQKSGDNVQVVGSYYHEPYYYQIYILNLGILQRCVGFVI